MQPREAGKWLGFRHLQNSFVQPQSDAEREAHAESFHSRRGVVDTASV